MTLSIFSCDYWPSEFLPWRHVFWSLLPIFFDWLVWFFLVLSCMSCLYILGSKCLSVTSFAHIFFHSVCCHLILFMASFALQKLLCLIGSHLFIFISTALGDWPKEINFLIFLHPRCLNHRCSVREGMSHLEEQELLNEEWP